MSQKIAFGLLWIGFIAYVFLLAPPNQPNTLELLQNLITGQWQGINPLIVALFNLLGIWPIIYACLLLVDGKTQTIPAWPFVLASFGTGAFALLPYFALRQPHSENSRTQSAEALSPLLKLLESRWLGIGVTLGTALLLGYGLIAGDWQDFAEQWQTSRFVHVMTIDFCLLCLLFLVPLRDDLQRRGLKQPQWFWLVASVPLLGPAVYLVLRPPYGSPDRSRDETEGLSKGY